LRYEGRKLVRANLEEWEAEVWGVWGGGGLGGLRGLRVLFAMRLRGVGEVRDGGTNVLCVRSSGDLLEVVETVGG